MSLAASTTLSDPTPLFLFSFWNTRMFPPSLPAPGWAKALVEFPPRRLSRRPQLHFEESPAGAGRPSFCGFSKGEGCEPGLPLPLLGGIKSAIVPGLMVPAFAYIKSLGLGIEAQAAPAARGSKG